MATAAAVTSAGVTLILPGQTAATRKAYPRLKGSSVAAGDKVLVAKVSGVYVVLDTII